MSKTFADKEHVMYCHVPIFGCNVMFCAVPSDMPLTRGDNISPTLGTDDKDEIRRIFAELAQGGPCADSTNYPGGASDAL